MSDNNNTTSTNDEANVNEVPKTQWGPIIKDMFILVCVMVTLGYLCKLAMVPFEHTSPTDSLVSIIRKGAVTNGKDDTFIKEMNQGMSTVENFVNYPDNTGRTPLMWAAYCNFNNTQEALKKDISRLYYVRALLATPGINAKATDRDGFTALHWAAWSGMPYTTVLLVDAGLDINQKDSNGYTPLMLAAMRGNEKVVSTLLSLGADAAAVNKGGKTACNLAVENEASYNKREAKILSWSGIPGLKDFNIFELIYTPARESSYLGTVKAFDAPPAAVSMDDLKREMETAENKAEAEAAKSAAKGE